MTGRVLFCLLLSAIAACSTTSSAQTAARRTPDADPHHFDASRYGEYIALAPNWLFAPGDNPAWASPGYDDSSWKTVSAEQNLYDYGIRDIRYGWYRMHVHLPPGTRNLTVSTRAVYGKYEVFANGVRIGGLGAMADEGVNEQSALRVFPVPDNLIGEGGGLVLAVRFAFNPSGNMGGRTSTPFGAHSIYLANRDVAVDEASYAAAHSAGPMLATGGLGLVVCLISCALYFALRSNREYLAIAVLLLAAGTQAAFAIWMKLVVYTAPAWFAMYAALAVENFALIEFVRLVLRLRRGRWLLGLEIVSSLAFLLNGTSILQLFSTYVYVLGFFVPVLAVKFVLPVLLIRGWRKGNREALLLFPAIFLGCFADYWNFAINIVSYAKLTWLYPYMGFAIPVGSYEIDLWRVGDFAFYLALLLFLVLRTVRIAHERAQAAAELEAARTVQQVLIPEEIPTVPGFVMHSIYHPAGQLGGDFFQILPLKNGGVLVVIGDVSGKGLPAAMTVSLLVGTVRTLAHYTQSPGAILAAMNQRMLSRSNGGFTTCLVLRADTDGKLTVANAGHIPPYLAGAELALESGLPLGLSAETSYVESSFQLSPNQQLTLLTDGVVEARDKAGALLGFERSAALSQEPAEEIARAAQSFGQDDDITILTMSYAGLPAAA